MLKKREKEEEEEEEKEKEKEGAFIELIIDLKGKLRKSLRFFIANKQQLTKPKMLTKVKAKGVGPQRVKYWEWKSMSKMSVLYLVTKDWWTL